MPADPPSAFTIDDVREARPDDLEVLVRFNQQMALETEGKRLSEAVLRRGVERGLAGRARYLVVEDAGIVIGCLMLTEEWSDWRDGRFLWIQSVFVARAHRRSGVYRALHHFVMALAERDPDVCGVRLYVEVENKIAMATYAQLGMRRCDYHMYEALTS